MKRRSLYVTSILGLLVATTLAFQNCNNKKFNTNATAHMKGSLASMDTGGEIDGEVISSLCDEEREIEAGNCPESIDIKFYAIEENSSKTAIGGTQALLTEYLLEGEKAYKYVFSFVVPNEHLCKEVEAYAVDPTTKAEILITPDASFILWGDTSQCETFTPPPPGSGGDVEIEGVRQDGRLVEVYGKCTGNGQVQASGDLNELIFKNEDCTASKFKHCDLLSKYSATNHIVEKQGSKQDAVDVMGPSPILVFTFDSFAKSGTKGITINGKCTVGGQVKLSIYGSTAYDAPCSANGTYSYTGTPLIPNLATRIMNGTLESRWGNVGINASVDSENQNLACSITSTTARADFCTKQAGVVKGNCVANLPVQVYVNGNQQNITYCDSAGKFEVKNVLLEKVGASNVVKIEQKNPYGRFCSDSRTLTQF